jgi:hypothetical protein
LADQEDSVAKVSHVKDPKHLRYSDLFTVVWVALVIAWCFVAKSAVERVLLPLLCPEAGPTAAGLWVTKHDGTLSNGAKLGGWRYTAYSVAHCGLWMGGCAVFTLVLTRIWPSKLTLNEYEARKPLKEPTSTDDLA